MKIDMTLPIQQLQEKLPSNIDVPLIEQEDKTCIHQQKKEIKELNKSASQYWEEHLQERIIQAAVDNNNKAEKIFNKLKEQKLWKKTRKIKILTKTTTTKNRNN